jgi:hypothetical protein
MKKCKKLIEQLNHFERIALVPTFNVPLYVGIRAGYWNVRAASAREVEIANLYLFSWRILLFDIQDLRKSCQKA